MRTRRLLIAVALVAALAAACDYPNVNPPGAAPVRYRDPIFASVVTTSDVTYGTATNLSNQTITLKLDVYAPPASDRVTKRPAVV